MRALWFAIRLSAVACTLLPGADLSNSAYRVLGQRGFQPNGANLVQGFELNGPAGLALDLRAGNARLYISDTNNHRVLAYADFRSYQAGEPPAIILGQSSREFSVANGIGPAGLSSPLGLAVDRTTGHLYVADSGNNRVVRFPDPFNNPGRVEPDAVYGQPSFNIVTAQTTRSNMNRPRAVAFDSSGNLWVADSGNQRLLRLAAATLDTPAPVEADAVLGQPDFNASAANAGDAGASPSGFDLPAALTFDAQDNLYVADFNNARVLRFSRGATAANAVWGQPDFRSRGVPAQVTPFRLAGPAAIAVDAARNVYVSASLDNRVLVFPPSSSSGATAVYGQQDFTTNTPNLRVAPRSSSATLSAPAAIVLDPEGNLFVADSANNRALQFSPGARTAARVWGQVDFTANAPNQVKPAGLNTPGKIAIDYTAQPFVLYVADTNNHRVLGWNDAARFRDGDPADFVIGQPDLFTALPNADTGSASTPSRTSLSRPTALSLDPADGSLWVADTGNNRVLRFPRPAAQSGRIAADVVLGQSDFSQNLSSRVSASSVRAPAGLAIGPDRNLFVADTGNHRVLEFPAGAASGTAAIRVYGQPDFATFSAPAQASAQTLNTPRGILVDRSYGLAVADSGSHRIVVYPNTQAAPASGAAAALVIGQDSFTASDAALLRQPADLAADADGVLYVADSGNHRVLAFPPLLFLPTTGAQPTAVIGQRDFNGVQPNWDSPLRLASQTSLSNPTGVSVDRQDTLYIADSGNHRVVHFLKRIAVSNAATNQPGPLAPGSIVTLAASALTTETPSTPQTSPSVWSEKMPGEWPKSQAGRAIVVNDENPAPIFALQAAAATFQLPQFTPLGTNRLAVRITETEELIAGTRIAVAASAPGLFTAAKDATQAAATNEDGRANSTSNPAIRGTLLTLTGTGPGQVSPPVADGSAASDAPLSRTVTVLASDVRGCTAAQAMCVVVGNALGEIQYSGLAPGFVGVWQVKLKIPQTVAPGNAIPVRVVINGAPSNTVTVAVR